MELPAMREAFGASAYPYSPAVRAGDFVYVSGQVPADADGVIVHGGIELQTGVALDNLRKALALAGCTLDDVVKCTVFLTDARDFAGFNKVYAKEFASPPPARSTVVTSLVIDAKIEIEAIAWRPRSMGERV
jgi:2-iminobutanoate/2-iminopropanoate deaminase